MFHYITFFKSDNHHQSKAEISKINPILLAVIVFVRLLIADLDFPEKTTKFAYTKSNIMDKHHIKTPSKYHFTKCCY